MRFFMSSFAISFSAALFSLTPLTSRAALQNRNVAYREGGQELEGYLAWDDTFVANGKHPGVLVVHEWMGLNPYARHRADQLAREGYVAFAADIYGKGIRPKNPEEAGKLAGKFKGDRPLLRRRVRAAWEWLRSQKNVDPLKVAAIGYCFGGTTVLELARSGADLAGVVSFHGGLENPQPNDAKNIKAKVLVLHGANDPFVNESEVANFEKEMKAAPQVDWQLVKYSGAVHAFTNPEAGSDPSKGAAYNAKADERSFQAMKDFFGEIFARAKK